MKKYVVQRNYGCDTFIKFFNKLSDARDYAKIEADSRHYQSIVVGRCDTCEVNEDGNVDFQCDKKGWAMCDYAKIYKRYEN